MREKLLREIHKKLNDLLKAVRFIVDNIEVKENDIWNKNEKEQIQNRLRVYYLSY